MRLEKLDDKLLVWQTGSKNNQVEYDSSEDLSKYSRRRLAYTETFLLENKEINEANKIKEYLGKILRRNNIPKLIPTNNYVVSTSLDMLQDNIDRFIERDNLQLNPDFQRGHVWTLEQRILYIEFILQGGETSPIWFNHEGWDGDYKGEMVVVDGKQRLTSLLMFLNNEFSVFKNLDIDNVGYRHKEFDNMFVHIKYGVNNLPTRKQVLQWYLQMNSGNIAHTSEELNRVEKLLEEENRDD